MADVNEAFHTALSTLPWPASQQEGGGTEPIYLTWDEVLGDYPAWASNQPILEGHMMTVHIFSKTIIGDELAQVKAALRAGGIKVTSWGPTMHEDDTGYYHLPITCQWTARLDG